MEDLRKQCERDLRGEHDRAVRLLRACSPFSWAWHSIFTVENIPDEATILAVAHNAQGDAALADAEADSRSLPLEQAAQEAIRLTSQHRIR
jgi:hypothetical protein